MSKKSDIKKIILIVLDTVRAGNIGAYTDSPVTPNINAFAKEGIIFKNAYTASTCTDPSVTSIMTGNYPLTSGLINHGRYIGKTEEKAISQIKLLAEILKENGFKTAAVDWLGRWHQRGFEYYSGKITNKNSFYDIANRFPFPLFMTILDKIAVKYLGREFFVRSYYAFSKNPTVDYDTADVVVDEGIKILKAKKKENKLFLYMHFWDAHTPHTRPRGLKSYIFDSSEDTYSAEIDFIDKQFGRFINFLKNENLLDETLIVLTADHGENLYGHDIPFNHENLYDDVVKVPLIFYAKKLLSGQISSPVQLIDIFPTLLDILKIDKFTDRDGKSLLPLVNKTKNKIRDFIYFEDITYRKLNFPANSRRRGIRIGKYKYIQTISDRKKIYDLNLNENLKIKKEEVLDLSKDKKEIHDLSGHFKKLGDLKSRMNNHILSLSNRRLKLEEDLFAKVNKSKKVIEDVVDKYGFNDIAIAWKGGKDTTTMMHIIRTMYGEIPFKVMFNDTTLEFEETYQFIKEIKKLWKLNLLVVRHDDSELLEYRKTKDPARKKELSRLMKITSINNALRKYKFKGFMLGIRRDENPSRADEKYFSKRPDHIRIHPMLDWTEEDIWRYINIFGVPYISLYDKGFRSVGEKEFTRKTNKGESERAGRDQEKEKLMGRLRKLGYW